MAFVWIKVRLAIGKMIGHMAREHDGGQIIRCAVPQIDFSVNVLKLKLPGLPENLHIEDDTLTAGPDRFPLIGSHDGEYFRAEIC